MAARRAHNPKVVSSNLTRATNSRFLFGLFAGVALVLGLAACDNPVVDTSVHPPYASPNQSPPAAVASRSCDKVKKGSDTVGIDNAKVELIRQGTDLQRISDDLTGAVPGGNFAVDSKLALRDATDLQNRLATSNLCDPLRSQLVAKAKLLKDADAGLVATQGDAGAASALQAAQAAYKALSDVVNNPPTS